MTARRDEAAAQSEPLSARLAELQAERTRLAAMVAILKRVAVAPNATDVVLTVTRELGEAYMLDRSSIILVDQAGGARIVASHEDPNIRNLSMDLSRYPEVGRAIASGKTVFLADVTAEPMSWMVRETLRRRNVASSVVVPITQGGKCVGALFLRTRRDQLPVTAEELRFFESVAALVANAFAKARIEAAAARQQAALLESMQRMDAQRVALIALVEQLLAQFRKLNGQADALASLTPQVEDEIGRMVDLAMRTVGSAAKKG